MTNSGVGSKSMNWVPAVISGVRLGKGDSVLIPAPSVKMDNLWSPPSESNAKCV